AAELLLTQKTVRNTAAGVTMSIPMQRETIQIPTHPNEVAFKTSIASFHRVKRRRDWYTPSKEKMRCQKKTKPKKIAIFWTLTRIVRNSSKEITPTRRW